MRTLYLFITDTLSDWEPGNVIAELRSGRYLKDPSLKYNSCSVWPDHGHNHDNGRDSHGSGRY